MMQFMQFTVGVLWISTLALSAFGWHRFYRDRTIGTISLTFEPRTPVRWGLIDLVFVVLSIVLGQLVVGVIATAVLGRDAADESPIVWMGISQIALAFTWAVVMLAMRFRCRTPIADLGLRFYSRDVALGAFAFGMLAVPMFAIQAFLAQFTDKKHPLIESLLEKSTTEFFIIGGIAAVVVAPVVEEYLFRVFFQGWLENLAAYHAATRRGVHFRPGFGADLFWGLGLRSDELQVPVLPEVENELQNVIPSPVEIQPSFGDPRDGDLTSDPPTDTIAPVDQVLEIRPARWPIFVSASVFAAAHIGNGPDPIPLFFLAVGLGHLYQRTHRVWPCITVHCLLNFLSLFNLWVIVNTPELTDKLLK